MSSAHTPEDLEMLFEDTLLLRDCDALATLFVEGAVLVVGDTQPARGGEQIAQLALETWGGDRNYIAEPSGVTQARDIALIVTKEGINVARCGLDRTWRYAIVLVAVGNGIGKEPQ